MKICDATQFYSEVGGGVRRYLTEKRNYIRDFTQDEHVLVVPGAKTEVICEGRLTTCTVASPRINSSSRYRILFNVQQAKQMVFDEKPDIIESGDPYQLGWAMLDAAQQLHIPIAGFYHSHFPEAYLRTVLKYCGPWLRDVVMAYAEDYICRLYDRLDLTLVPSEFLAKVLEGWGVRNTASVHLGVNTNVYFPKARNPEIRRSLGISENARLLLYVGRLAGEKNTATLLESIQWLYKHGPRDIEVLIIGDGAQRPTLLRYQESNSRLHWIPYCSDPFLLADYYRAADLFVHPGVCETFGLVALESQACACPVLGIRGSYMDANIFSGLEHWARKNNPEILGKAILHFLDLDLKKMGSQASLEVCERYAWPKVFERIWGLYSLAIERKRESLLHGALYQAD
ncbi:MAG: glycosyltransferase [Blastochloris sp.]|jgi:alpha-1,6-mannosyltransferase|nr:glycosyltransferase [Blastochloris sp.]